MNKKELMNIILSSKKELCELMLSSHQIDIVRFIESKGSVYSADIADKFSISIQSASGTLKTILNKGYLKREELTAPSGGKEFKWSCTVKFKD